MNSLVLPLVIGVPLALASIAFAMLWRRAAGGQARIVAELEDQLRAEQARAAEAEARVDQQRQVHEKASERLAARATDLHAKLTKCVRLYKQLEQRLAEKPAAIAPAQPEATPRQIADLNVKLEQQSELIEQLQASIASHKEQVLDLQKTLDERDSVAAELRRQLADTSAAHAASQADAIEADFAPLEFEDPDAPKGTPAAECKESAALIGQVEAIKQEVEAVTLERDRLTERLLQLEAVHHELERSYLSNAESQSSTMALQIQALEEQLTAATKRAEDAAAELAEASNHSTQLTRELNAAKASLTAVEQERDALGKQINELKRESDKQFVALEARHAEQKQRAEQLEQQCNRQQAEVRQLQAEAERQQATITGCHRRIEELWADLAAANSQAAELATKLASESREVSRLRKAIAYLEQSGHPLSPEWWLRE